MGRPALAVGGIALIGAGIVIATGWQWTEHAEVSHQLTERIDTVGLDTGSGDVRITVRDVTSTSIRERLSYSGPRPGQTYRVDGGRLVLTGCGGDCTVDYDIVVPRGATVSGGSRSGDVRLSGVSADVSSTSGDIRVDDATGPVRARSSSGDIRISLAGPHDVSVDANAGDIDLAVPDDRYRVSSRTASGDQKIDVATDPTGPYLLDLRSASGDISVRRS